MGNTINNLSGVKTPRLHVFPGQRMTNTKYGWTMGPGVFTFIHNGKDEKITFRSVFFFSKEQTLVIYTEEGTVYLLVDTYWKIYSNLEEKVLLSSVKATNLKRWYLEFVEPSFKKCSLGIKTGATNLKRWYLKFVEPSFKKCSLGIKTGVYSIIGKKKKKIKEAYHIESKNLLIILDSESNIYFKRKVKSIKSIF